MSQGQLADRWERGGQLMVNIRQYRDSRFGSLGLAFARHAGARAQSPVARVGEKAQNAAALVPPAIG